MYALLINLMANDRVRVVTPGKIARDSHRIGARTGITAGFEPPPHPRGPEAEPELSRHVR